MNQLKRTFIAFMIVNEIVDESTGETWPVLKPHDHPVFTGKVAYDLGAEQNIQVDEVLDVREFVSEGECLAAINDYYREDPNPVSVGAFYLVSQMTSELVTVAKNKGSKSKGK